VLRYQRTAVALVTSITFVSSCARSGALGKTPTPKIGPEKGTAIVVGGGNVGPEIWSKFIQLAGGPDALIIDIPTAGGQATYGAVTGTSAQIVDNGAKNVVVLHTVDRKIADSDSFVALIRRAGGVWFEGGRQNLLVDAYAGTKAEVEFHNVLKRGGVVAGSSAGASIQGSFLIRGASNGNTIMDAPGRNVGFGFVKVGIDQHVVARERLPDLADSVMKKYPQTLFISEDEGTAWLVQGDNAEIIGRNKAFVYNGKDTTDTGKPFLTLHPGDKYDLNTRRVTHRAITESPLTHAWVDSLFRANVGTSAATVVIAQGGKVFVNRSWNIPPQRRFTPTTSMPSFELGDISRALNAAVSTIPPRQGPPDSATAAKMAQWMTTQSDVNNAERTMAFIAAFKAGVSYQQAVTRRLYGPSGMQRTTVDTLAGTFKSNVDDLYRLELAVLSRASSASAAVNPTNTDGPPIGWLADRFAGQRRISSFAAPNGRRAAFVRFPDRKAAIIILTDNDAIDARAMADAIAAKLLSR
jgi:cyanophycinase